MRPDRSQRSPEPQPEPVSPPIEDHAVIGDLRTAALVGLDGTVPFLCAPSFDSPTVFARLLDPDGGHFSLRPKENGLRTTQRYLPDTNVLLTRFMSEDGIAELVDWMPPDTGGEESRPQCLTREVRVIRGSFRFQVECAPRFGYATLRHTLESHGNGGVFRPRGGEEHPVLRLLSSVPLRVRRSRAGGDLVGTVRLGTGDCARFVLEIGPEEQGSSELDAAGVDASFEATAAWWRRWTGGIRYQGRWREVVGRSALVLKLMMSARHGAMVAAATFGLPERPHGGSNWDYRYCWVRDTSFAMYAFIRLGLVDEAEHFVEWIGARVRECAEAGAEEPLRIMYALDGHTELDERELPHLRGWNGARPVLVGNGAADQLQLDIYGELMDSVYLAHKYGRGTSWEGWQHICRAVEWLRENWRRPDRGIWEVRSGDEPNLHSRLMCWVTMDRAIRLAQKRSLPAPLPEWNETRVEIHHSIHEEFWRDDLDSFVRTPGSDLTDGSMLLMPLLRFISGQDPRWLGTMRRCKEQLVVDALVFRRPPGTDGHEEQEGSFLACSFWYVEALARAGEIAEARLLFDKLLGYANHVGLYAEELSFSGRHLGNFPQVLTHLALISAASYLDRVLSGDRMQPWR